MELRIFEHDPSLRAYEADIIQRTESYKNKKRELTEGSINDFANAHEYFGFHKTDEGWYYREWAPAADDVYLTGDMVNWKWMELRLTPIGNGVFEIFLPGTNALWDGCHVKTIIKHKGAMLERISPYIRRVEQDSNTHAWCGIVTDEPLYGWQNERPKKPNHPFIYECHIGMAQEKEGIGSYTEFRDNILPKIKKAGYNTVQIMAVMEHPYYGSFGYQVSNFYAVSSKFGTANDLKSLIDTAHGMGLYVLLDVVHSHAVNNTSEGLNEFDGTVYQYFHEGTRGDHPAWGTKLFNYGKNEVLHFLLSNLKYYLTEFRFDGFRFDGVTSMLYHDHGLGSSFTDYSKYFSVNTDTEAVTYLMLANELIREVYKDALTVAEDMSAMPGMCLPINEGGIGFDYRLAMGTPDMWIKLIKEVPDEKWDMWHIWCELTSRRPGEKYIGYAESHDQALVGDKTIMFRLCDKNMYTSMSKLTPVPIIDRGMALHKLIRLTSLTLSGEGYLNFMGNEFGHPEWIDFPREGNGWSYKYCRRQWQLAEDTLLRYGELLEFDRAMVGLAKNRKIFGEYPKCLFIDADCQVLNYSRKNVVFALNFSPERSYEGYYVTVPEAGNYRVVMSTDEERFGGFGRIDGEYVYASERQPDGTNKIRMYLPARSGACIVRVK